MYILASFNPRLLPEFKERIENYKEWYIVRITDAEYCYMVLKYTPYYYFPSATKKGIYFGYDNTAWLPVKSYDEIIQNLS